MIVIDLSEGFKVEELNKLIDNLPVSENDNKKMKEEALKLCD